MGEDEDRCVVRRLVTPPATPVVVPRAADGSEHVAPHDVRAARGREVAASRGVGLVPRLVGAPQPLVQEASAAAYRVVAALVGAGEVAVERDGHVTGGQAHTTVDRAAGANSAVLDAPSPRPLARIARGLTPSRSASTPSRWSLVAHRPDLIAHHACSRSGWRTPRGRHAIAHVRWRRFHTHVDVGCRKPQQAFSPGRPARAAADTSRMKREPVHNSRVIRRACQWVALPWDEGSRTIQVEATRSVGRGGGCGGFRRRHARHLPKRARVLT